MSTKLKIDIGNIKLDIEGGELVVLEIYKDFKKSITENISQTNFKIEDEKTNEKLPVKDNAHPPKEQENKAIKKAGKTVKPPKERTVEKKPVKTESTSSEKDLPFKSFVKRYEYETVYEQLLIAAYYFYLEGKKNFTRIDYINLLKKNGLHTNSTRNSCGYSLGMLQKKKYITKLDRGLYKILPHGIEAVKEMEK
ncbi:MAG: hypothetical protein ACLFSQ_05230 [Candidatus Zixiibacteriota bacterium]